MSTTNRWIPCATHHAPAGLPCSTNEAFISSAQLVCAENGSMVFHVTPKQPELLTLPVQPSEDDRLSSAIRIIEERFHGDFRAFANAVAPRVLPDIESENAERELIAEVLKRV